MKLKPMGKCPQLGASTLGVAIYFIQFVRNVKPGDRVSEFDNICEVQSDKATVGITSRYDGIIKKIHHDVEGTVKVGQALIDIEVESTEEVPGMMLHLYVQLNI